MTRTAKAPAIIPSLTTEEVHAAIDRRYFNDPRRAMRYVVVHEVRNASGFDANRVCDALVCHCWPSDGLTLSGIEVKVARSDWLRELKSPRKAEAFAQHCHQWWVAAGGVDVVQLEELPPGWGLLVPAKGGDLRAVRTPKHNTPYPPDHSFLASLLRSAIQQQVGAKITAAVVEARKEERHNADFAHRHQAERLDKLQTMVTEFEQRSGIRLTEWNWGDQAEAVRLLSQIRSGGYESLGERLKGARNLLAAALKGVEQALEGAAAVDQALKGETAA